MKKQWIALLVTLLMLLSMVNVGAEGEYTLLEKGQKQLDAGSGMKGTITLAGLNNSPLLPGMGALSIDVQYIDQKEKAQLQLALSSAASALLQANLYRQNETLAAKVSLLPDRLITLPDGLQAFLDIVLGNTGEARQTSWYTAAAAFLFEGDEAWQQKAEAVIAPYLTKVELWMQGYANQPVLGKDASGQSVMQISYRIPGASVKAELKQLLMDLLGDEAFLSILKEKIDVEQANLYLNPALQAYYFQAVDNLPLTEEVHVQRSVSTMGEPLDLFVSLPLPSELWGLKNIAFFMSSKESEDAQQWTVKTLDGTWTLETQASKTVDTADAQTFAGIIRYLPEEMPNWKVGDATLQYTDKALSVSYQATLTKSMSVDADNKTNETYKTELVLQPDWSHLEGDVTDAIKAQYAVTAPVKLSAQMLLKSGQARNAATSMDIQVNWESEGAGLALTGQLKTTAPWAMEEISLDSALPMDQMTAEELGALKQEFLEKIMQLFLGQQSPPAEVDNSVG